MKLTDICDVQGGSQPPKEEWSFEEQEGYIRMLQIRDFTQSERVTPEYIKISNSTKICEADDILIARYGASIGKILTGLAGAYNVAIMRTIPDTSKIKKKYLYYYLKSPYFQNAILNVGSRAAQAGFNKEDLSKLDIECPELSEQENIASILDKVEIVIRKRKEELVFLDKLIKARFVEMFGDPVSNPFEWDIVAFDDCLESIENGKSFVCDSVARADGKPAILKLSAATHGVYKPEENKAIINEEDFVESAEVHDGDLLFTRKNTPELVGMAVYVESTPKKLMMPDLIFRLNTKTNCNKIFMWKLINHDLYRSQIESAASGSAKSMSNISKERLGKLRFPLPPLELQEQFVDFVKQVDKSKVIDTNIIPRGGFYNGHEFCISK